MKSILKNLKLCLCLTSKRLFKLTTACKLPDEQGSIVEWSDTAEIEIEDWKIENITKRGAGRISHRCCRYLFDVYFQPPKLARLATVPQIYHKFYSIG